MLFHAFIHFWARGKEDTLWFFRELLEIYHDAIHVLLVDADLPCAHFCIAQECRQLSYAGSAHQHQHHQLRLAAGPQDLDQAMGFHITVQLRTSWGMKLNLSAGQPCVPPMRHSPSPLQKALGCYCYFLSSLQQSASKYFSPLTSPIPSGTKSTHRKIYPFGSLQKDVLGAYRTQPSGYQPLPCEAIPLISLPELSHGNEEGRWALLNDQS